MNYFFNQQEHLNYLLTELNALDKIQVKSNQRLLIGTGKKLQLLDKKHPNIGYSCFENEDKAGNKFLSIVLKAWHNGHHGHLDRFSINSYDLVKSAISNKNFHHEPKPKVDLSSLYSSKKINFSFNSVEEAIYENSQQTIDYNKVYDDLNSFNQHLEYSKFDQQDSSEIKFKINVLNGLLNIRRSLISEHDDKIKSAGLESIFSIPKESLLKSHYAQRKGTTFFNNGDAFYTSEANVKIPSKKLREFDFLTLRNAKLEDAFIIGYRNLMTGELQNYQDLNTDKKLTGTSYSTNGMIYAFTENYNGIQSLFDSKKTVILAEGVYTANALYQSLNPSEYFIISTANANNLKVVVKMINDYAKEHNQKINLIIGADNDTDPSKSMNTGLDFALELTKQYSNVKVRYPIMPHKLKCDWDDLHREYGIAEVSRQFYQSKVINNTSLLKKPIADIYIHNRYVNQVDIDYLMPDLDKAISQDYRCIYTIDSPLGTGKTEIIKDIVKHLEAKGIYSVLYISKLRSTLGSASERLQFEYYEKFQNAPYKLAYAGKLTITDQSLPKLMRHLIEQGVDCPKVIIIDEIDQVFQNINGLNRQEQEMIDRAGVTKTLQTFVCNANIVIGLDGTITKYTIDTLKDFTSKAPRNTLFHHVYNSYKMTNETIDLFHDDLKFFNQLQVIATGTNKFAIGFDTKAKCLEVENHIKKLNPNLKIFVIHADSKGDDIKAFKRNPTQFIEENQIDVLLYSPSLTTGFSIDNKNYFDYSMNYFTYRFLMPRDHFQMMMRVRHAKKRIVYLNIADAEQDYFTSKDNENLLRTFYENSTGCSYGTNDVVDNLKFNYDDLQAYFMSNRYEIFLQYLSDYGFKLNVIEKQDNEKFKLEKVSESSIDKANRLVKIDDEVIQELSQKYMLDEDESLSSLVEYAKDDPLLASAIEYQELGLDKVYYDEFLNDDNMPFYEKKLQRLDIDIHQNYKTINKILNIKHRVESNSKKIDRLTAIWKGVDFFEKLLAKQLKTENHKSLVSLKLWERPINVINELFDALGISKGLNGFCLAGTFISKEQLKQCLMIVKKYRNFKTDIKGKTIRINVFDSEFFGTKFKKQDSDISILIRILSILGVQISKENAVNFNGSFAVEKSLKHLDELNNQFLNNNSYIYNNNEVLFSKISSKKTDEKNDNKQFYLRIDDVNFKIINQRIIENKTYLTGLISLIDSELLILNSMAYARAETATVTENIANAIQAEVIENKEIIEDQQEQPIEKLSLQETYEEILLSEFQHMENCEVNVIEEITHNSMIEHNFDMTYYDEIVGKLTEYFSNPIDNIYELVFGDFEHMEDCEENAIEELAYNSMIKHNFDMVYYEEIVDKLKQYFAIPIHDEKNVIYRLQ